MMKFNIKNLAESLDLKKVIKLTNYEVVIDTNQVVIINGDLKLTYDELKLFIKGKFEGQVKMRCSRCDREYLEVFDIEIDEIFEEDNLIKAPAKDIYWDKNSIKVFPLIDGMVDISEVVRDNVIISLPIRPLCSLECTGIDFKAK